MIENARLAARGVPAHPLPEGHWALWHDAACPVSVPGVLDRGPPILGGHGVDRLWRVGAL
jgi:hypothetical protein